MTKTEEMKRLEAAMASDKELREKFSKTVDRIATEKTVQSDGDLFAKAAQELGYNITAADFEKLDAEREEVSADELEQVAGGGSEDDKGHDQWCFTAWHCFTATLHTSTETKWVSCWKDYSCAFVYNDDWQKKPKKLPERYQ